MDPDEQPPQSPTLSDDDDVPASFVFASDDEQISLAAETPPERAATPPPTPAAAAAAETPRTPKGAVKRWCFTVNNPGTWEPLADVDDMAEIGYIVWQTERGDREGTTHIQGYVRFQRRMRLNAVKQFFKRRDMHLEGARGSEAQNKDYCTKESSRVDGTHGEAGEYDPKQGQQGRRSDLEAIAEEVKRGDTIPEIAARHPGDFIRYGQGIERLAEVIAPPPPVQRVVTNYVLWGPTGVGKTHRVLTTFANVYQVLGRGRDPWGRYRGQDVLLLDEFDYKKWSPQELNAILDKWRFPLDARYHDKYAAWTLVFICCNDNPNSWYSDAFYSQEIRAAVRRRLSSSCRLVESREPALEDVLRMEANPNWS